MNNPPASVDTVTATAPERIWLQVSDESIDRELEFPGRHEDITCRLDSTLACEVEYSARPRPGIPGPSAQPSPMSSNTTAMTWPTMVKSSARFFGFASGRIGDIGTFRMSRNGPQFMAWPSRQTGGPRASSLRDSFEAAKRPIA